MADANTNIQQVGVDEIRGHPGVQALFERHYEEVALHKDVMQLDPSWDHYYALEEQGMLLVLGVFVDQVLVGYSVNFFDGHLHHQQSQVCYNDLLFVDPSHRRGRLGLRLVHATEDAARQRGACLILWQAKPHTALDTLLLRQGYGVQDIIYSKALN
jgi:predicted GNAT superfamily acetyltransferase